MFQGRPLIPTESSAWRADLNRVRPILLLALLAQSPSSPAAAQPFEVGVVPSDDESLAAPSARTDSLTADQVLQMVRRAVDLVGGMEAFVPDTARRVAIKPNVTIPEPSGSGIVTDARVVRAVAILVHEAAPGARISIAEGAGGWISPSLKDSTDQEYRVADGFEIAGHRATVRELRQRGVDIECVDLNFDRPVRLAPPGGGLADPDYDIAATIVEADAWINCPVAKTHGAKITAAMKNHLGILPGHIYGWNKGSGTDRRPAGIPHAPRVQDECWVDLWGLTEVDLNVVDMIAGSEGGAFGGTPRRANTIVAGADPVATDLVVARLMGFNPDDFEFADLAWQQGRGPGVHENIRVLGGDVESLAMRYVKAGIDYGGGDWTEQANYGMGPRRWTLLGPVERDHRFTPEEAAALRPVPGRGGWSEVTWFGHDKIDLDSHFDDPIHCAVYAYTTFTMARPDSVRFWLGSDEDLSVWIDGEPLYEFEGRRRHMLGQVQLPGYLEAGEHRLLVRASQRRGRFDFSFNVCEPIDDPLFAGNRYPGVRYSVTGADPLSPPARVRSEDVYDGWFSEERVGGLGRGEPLEAAFAAPDSILLQQPPTPTGESLLGAVADAAGLRRADLDSLTLATLSRPPFWSGAYSGPYSPTGWPRYGPEPPRMLEWLGLGYSISSGFKARESLKEIKGWLSWGLPVVIGDEDQRWKVAAGYRETAEGIELYELGPEEEGWRLVDDQWWARFPDRLWRNCPFLVVERRAEPLSESALVDSVAALALELGLTPWSEDQPEPWGAHRRPAGLHAWDCWVRDWERLPWTEEWLAGSREARTWLAEVGTDELPELIEARRTAARYLLAAAGREGPGRRRELLQAAGTAYQGVADELDEETGGLQRDLGVVEGEADSSRIEPEKARVRVRAARRLEREALQALSDLLDRGPIPPPAEDPLSAKDRGVRLFTWRSGYAGGVYEIHYDNAEGLRYTWLHGRESEQVTTEVHGPVPEDGGWLFALETEGEGYYEIRQNPSADNGWTAVVRTTDFRWRRLTHEVEVTLWAVPAPTPRTQEEESR